MEDDQSLLQRYVNDNAPEAFEALAARHLQLIYSAALRVTGDTHLADDVTQAVLLILARKAPELKTGNLLPGWLLTTTRLTALNAVRARNAQRKLDRAAIAMNQHLQTDEEGENLWTAVAPHLDEALAALSDDDRTAVAVRYFNHGSNDDVARQLGVTRDVAEKRVTRALEKLRRFFSRKGVGLSCLVLAGLLGARGAHAAPAALVATAAKTALSLKAASATAGAATSVASLAGTTMKSMALAKLKIVFLIVGSALLAALLGAGAIWGGWFSSSPRPAPPPAKPAAVVMPASKNLLTLIDLPTCSINGHWRSVDGELHSDRSAYSRVMIPYEAPAEYNFSIDFTVIDPYSDVTLICSKNGHPFCWKVGVRNQFCVFEMIDGIGHGNPTQRERLNCFEPGSRHTASVTVRNDGAYGYLDGECVSEFKSNFSSVGIFDFYALPDPRALGLASYCTPAIIHKAELLEITGSGRDLPHTKSFARPPPPDPALWNNAVNLLPLIDPARHSVSGVWHLEAGTLKAHQGQDANLEIPYLPPAEYLFRIVFSRDIGSGSVAQILGHEHMNFAWHMASNSTDMLFDQYAQSLRNPTFVYYPNGLRNSDVHTSIVHVRKDGFTSYLDGQLVSHWAQGDNRFHLPNWVAQKETGMLGLYAFRSAVTFYSVEVVELDGTGSIENQPEDRRSPDKRATPPSRNEDF